MIISVDGIENLENATPATKVWITLTIENPAVAARVFEANF